MIRPLHHYITVKFQVDGVSFFLCILKLLIPAQDVKILHELYFPDSKTLL